MTSGADKHYIPRANLGGGMSEVEEEGLSMSVLALEAVRSTCVPRSCGLKVAIVQPLTGTKTKTY